METPEIDAHRRWDLGNIRCVGGVGFGLDYVGSRPDGLSAVHEREYDVVREPLHSDSGDSSASDVEIVLPGGNSFGFAMSSGGVNGEVGIAGLAGLVLLRKLDVDFVFCIRADVMRRAVGEEAEHGRRIHSVHIALDDPLISSEAEVLGRKQFGGGPFSILLDDTQMQVSVRIDRYVGWISKCDTRHVSIGQFPRTSRPRDALGMSVLHGADRKAGEDYPD